MRKGNIYPVLKRVLNKNVKIIIISKPRISVQGIYLYPLFFTKREISFEGSTFGGSLFSGGSLLSGFANACNILWRLTFEGSLLLELYGIKVTFFPINVCRLFVVMHTR